MIGIFDGDHASITLGHADPAKGKAYDDAIIGGVVTSPRVMRQMPRLLQAARLQLVASFPYVVAEVCKADFWAPAIDSFRRLDPKSGAMTEQEDPRQLSAKPIYSLSSNGRVTGSPASEIFGMHAMLARWPDEQAACGGKGLPYLHLIHADNEVQDLSASSKLNAECSYLELLFESGRGCTRQYAKATMSNRTVFELSYCTW